MAKSTGELRHRITIRQKTVTINQRGFTEEVWEPVCTVWASVENLRGREYFQAAAVQAETTVRFTIRYRPGLNTAMRIAFDGKEYNITFIDHVDYRRAFMELLAEEVGRGGK